MASTRMHVFASALMLLVTSISRAQHHGGGGHHQSTYHHGANWGHSSWSYVLPSHTYYGQDHHGTYYVNAGQHYYTPTLVAYDPKGHVAAAPPQAPVPLKFGGFSNCEDLTGRFEAEANNFCLDLYYNYSQNAGFQETYREAYQVLQSAKYIHAAEHQGDRAEITRRVAEIDRQFHHVQNEVAGMQPQPQRQIAGSNIATKSQSMEAVMHHLAHTVGVTPHSAQPQPGGTTTGREEAPPPPSISGPAGGVPPAPVPR